MSDIDLKTPAIVIAVCMAIGGAIDYFSGFNWIAAGLVLLTVLLVNSLVIDVEDRQPGGWDFDENETIEAKKQYKKVVGTQIGIIILVVGAAIWSVSDHS